MITPPKTCPWAGSEVDDGTLVQDLQGPETYVAQNLVAIICAHLPAAQLGFWHVQGRHEVDFVVSSGRTCIGIEVKAGSRFDERDLTNLGRFAETTRGVSALILAYNGTQAVSLGKKLYAIPIAMLLS